MQQSLATSVNNIRRVNDELEQRNEELTRAYQLQLDTNREKAAFIQKMYHEIRTPLNIISGFAQVLTASLPDLPPDEIADITGRISESANNIDRLAKDLDKAARSS
jgi:sigma-B regulation protein RsbU (phosphoserine phosphatase)